MLLRSLRAAAFSVAALAGTVALAPTRDARAQNMSVVYVDVDKVINDCAEGKDATEVLKKEQVKRQSEIQSRETELKKMQDELEKQAKAFSAAAIEKKAAHYQQAFVEYQNLVMKYQRELEVREKELFDPIEKRVKDMLRELALRDGYAMILNKRSVPYGRKDLDLTDKVVQEYNKAYPVAQPAAAPKKPAAKPAPKQK